VNDSKIKLSLHLINTAGENGCSQYSKPTFSKTNKAVVAMKKIYIYVCFFKKSHFLSSLACYRNLPLKGPEKVLHVTLAHAKLVHLGAQINVSFLRLFCNTETFKHMPVQELRSHFYEHFI